MQTPSTISICFPKEINAINLILYEFLGFVSAEGNKTAHPFIVFPNSVTGHNLRVNRVGGVIIVDHAKWHITG